MTIGCWSKVQQQWNQAVWPVTSPLWPNHFLAWQPLYGPRGIRYSERALVAAAPSDYHGPCQPWPLLDPEPGHSIALCSSPRTTATCTPTRLSPTSTLPLVWQRRCLPLSNWSGIMTEHSTFLQSVSDRGSPVTVRVTGNLNHDRSHWHVQLRWNPDGFSDSKSRDSDHWPDSESDRWPRITYAPEPHANLAIKKLSTGANGQKEDAAAQFWSRHTHVTTRSVELSTTLDDSEGDLGLAVYAFATQMLTCANGQKEDAASFNIPAPRYQPGRMQLPLLSALSSCRAGRDRCFLYKKWVDCLHGYMKKRLDVFEKLGTYCAKKCPT